MGRLKGTKPATDRCRFVIVTRARSGSYHLVDMLDSAGDIVCHGEVFKEKRIELERPYLRGLGVKSRDVERRDADPLGFLRRLVDLEPRRHVGFKAFGRHLSNRPALVDGVLLSAGWRKLFLFRNPLETYASRMRAELTDMWLVREGNEAEVTDEILRRPITFTPETFESHIVQWKQFRDLYRSAREATPDLVLRIGYNGLQKPRVLQRILDFLGSSSPIADLKSGLVKQYRGRFRDGIANWDAFEAHARQLGLARQLAKLSS